MLRKIQKIVDFTLEPQIDVAAGNSGSPDSRDQGDKDNGSSIHKRLAENKEKVTNTPKKNNHRQERDSL